MRHSITYLIVFSLAVATSQAAAVTFDVPIHLDPPVNIAGETQGPWESSDGLTLYFTSNRAGGQGSASIWQATRATLDDPFTNPTNIAATNSSSRDFAPRISYDGLTLLFTSKRPGVGNGDTWQSTRASINDPFGAPTLVPNVNSVADDGGASLSMDGLTMYFFSRRGGGQGQYDLYEATRPTINDDFGTPVNMGTGVNGPDLDYAPTVTSDGLTMYYVSERSGSLGPSSIWKSTRTSVNDPFGAPSLVPNVNSISRDEAPAISADGKRLYFISDRPAEFGGWDIFVANAVEDPSNASFSTGADVNVLDIDFGTVGLGATVSPIDFDIANFATIGSPASLQFETQSGTGDTAVLTTNFGLNDPIQSGEFESFQSFLDTNSPGIFSASYELNFTDVLGTDQTLTLNLTGHVLPTPVPEPSTYAMAAMGLIALGYGGWRRKRTVRKSLTSAISP